MASKLTYSKIKIKRNSTNNKTTVHMRIPEYRPRVTLSFIEDKDIHILENWPQENQENQTGKEGHFSCTVNKEDGFGRKLYFAKNKKNKMILVKKVELIVSLKDVQNFEKQMNRSRLLVRWRFKS
jgi:hypothetical protein